jgi:hypothetical protein
MSAIGGPNVVEGGLVLALDAANDKSFRGEPTINLTISDNNFTGTGYSPDGEWTPNPTVFNKSYDSSIKTPVGVGATLLSESGTGGFHHLSRWGGGGTGNHSLSCYIYPLSNDIDDFTVGLLGDINNMITFNLINKTITYGGGAVANSAFIQTVDGFPGWLRVGGNHGGRDGGWVGCVGLLTGTSYTGSAGAKSFYITGLQYETKPSPTFFTPAGTTRGTTVATGGGWADRSGNSNHGELVNGPTFSSGNLGSIVFDGVDDYVFMTGFPTSNFMSLSCWFRTNTQQNNKYIVAFGKNLTSNNGFDLTFQNTQIGSFIAVTGTNSGGNLYTVNYYDNVWHHLVSTYDGSASRLYYDGNLVSSRTGMSGNLDIEATKRLNIGSWVNNSVNASCNISQTSIYNRALSTEEVLQNFNATKGRYGL